MGCPRVVPTPRHFLLLVGTRKLLENPKGSLLKKFTDVGHQKQTTQKLGDGTGTKNW